MDANHTPFPSLIPCHAQFPTNNTQSPALPHVHPLRADLHQTSETLKQLTMKGRLTIPIPKHLHTELPAGRHARVPIPAERMHYFGIRKGGVIEGIDVIAKK